VAATPFTLPNPIHLPEEPIQQWQLHIDRMSAAITLEQAMHQSHGADNGTLNHWS